MNNISQVSQQALNRNRMRLRGTADQYEYVLEEKIINGQKVMVKQYGCVASDDTQPHSIIESSSPYPQIEE